ncbi:MAG: membrane-bound lytic murein transglycosylase MltF [Desulfobacterales bacterium]|nr:membrane-bound lytic murein transglycosylase MltF [Desulfobacterales bacterium]
MNAKKTPLVARKRLSSLLLAGSLFLGACGENGALERIQEARTITVVTRNNAHCYYTYRDQEMGFEYDLAKAFADFLGVALKVKVSKSSDGLIPLLYDGAGDFVAASIAKTPSRLKAADFSRGYLPVQQVVIIHKNNTDIKNIDDLEGETIDACGGTPQEERLRELNRQGFNITVREHDDISTEELIGAVARGKIEITIANSNVALLNRRYYPDMRIAFPVDEPKSLGWAVKKAEKALLDKINEFFTVIEQDGTFKDIYNRYYAYVERFDHLDIKRFQKRIKTHLPRYKKTIIKAAETYGFDWRLITALLYQESQFDPWAKSFSGVRGLMQLTRPTAKEMGVKNRLDPNQSIMGGARYLRVLYDLYDGAPDSDRGLVALAAYNVGTGHIFDARRIASKMQLDPNKWASLEKTLPLLCQSKYYKRSKYGYCRGTEPVFHVQRVLTYYDILKRRALNMRDKE